MALPLVTPDMGFDEASEVVLTYLHESIPLALWSVTRIENGQQTFLYLNEDNSYRIGKGDSTVWEDTFCIHMSAGRTPAIALTPKAVPQYAAAIASTGLPIGTYAGAVIEDAKGELFGTICGFDPDQRFDDQAWSDAGPTLMLFGQLLTMVLAADRARGDAAQALFDAQLAAETDQLTGLYNRRAWERIVAEEEERYQRLADPTVAMMMDLDHLKAVNDTQGHAAGDLYIQTAARELANSVKAGDFVARLGGDEFALLLRNCTETQAEAVVERIYANFESSKIAGSLGWAPITVVHGFPEAIAQADAAMYAAKSRKRVKQSRL